jgi:hypothetical protein
MRLVPADQRPGGDQDRLTGQRHPGALERHAEEDRQVAVPSDQMQQVAQHRHVAARAFMARLTSTTGIFSESSACLIIRNLTPQLKTGGVGRTELGKNALEPRVRPSESTTQRAPTASKATAAGHGGRPL